MVANVHDNSEMLRDPSSANSSFAPPQSAGVPLSAPSLEPPVQAHLRCTSLLGSKYLKATQELLDEVVNINSGIKVEIAKKSLDRTKVAGESSTAGSSELLSTTERQEIQMKKAKLINMLDEVEQRYRQYHNQIQVLISSFEQVAGMGSARTYTSLALRVISKLFRCLKDAITGQIRAANKRLGEEDCSKSKIEASGLEYVDRHDAWRLQRRLPEKEHFESIITKGSFSVTSYLHNIRSIADELSLIGHPLDDNDVVIQALNGLDASFHEFTASLQTCDTPLSFDELYDKLMDFEVSLQCANHMHHSSPERAHHNLNSDVVCQLCDKKGHGALTCYKFLNNSHSSASTPTTNTAEDVVPPPESLLDSGALHHITNDLNNLSLTYDWVMIHSPPTP